MTGFGIDCRFGESLTFVNCHTLFEIVVAAGGGLMAVRDNKWLELMNSK